jgi:hypothetical protein
MCPILSIREKSLSACYIDASEFVQTLFLSRGVYDKPFSPFGMIKVASTALLADSCGRTVHVTVCFVRYKRIKTCVVLLLQLW